jgi:hypothetical protein
VQPEWDTTGYTFQWDVDGTAIASSNTLVWSAPSASPHTLKGITVRSDGVADTVSLVVNASIGVQIGGPDVAPSGTQNTWIASVSGAQDPVTCTWYIDGSQAQSGSCTFSWTFSDGPSSHNLDVKATDANNQDGWALTKSVSVCTGCGQELPVSKAVRPRVAPAARP